MIELAAVAAEPNALASHYSRFRVADRLLLTGHSHQAWPDCAAGGLERAFADAAELVDEKWTRAFAKAECVRRGFRALLGDPDGDLTLAASTHDLVVRWLSALPLARRPRLVTSDGEFHSITRQLRRLAEEGIEVVWVPARPADGLAERLAAAVDDRTAAVLCSSVLYETADIVPCLGDVAVACRRVGAVLLVDAYHQLGVVPFDLAAAGLEDAYVVGGGYKYLQLGEGNCFLRSPAGCELRPVVTGWFADFAALDRTDAALRVGYGDGGGRFAGSTYDPVSHYRAAEVLDFFSRHQLTPPWLAMVSRHQVGRLAARFDALDLDPAVIRRDPARRPEAVAGFLALESAQAGELARRLRERGVLVDHRGRWLRFGPAPYLCDRQLDAAMAALGDSARSRV